MVWRRWGRRKRAEAAANLEEVLARAARLAAFCRHGGLDWLLHARDWAGFALRYNGPGEAENDYAGRLCAAYQQHATMV